MKLYSLLTGALFILIITRNLSLEEFGAWSTISSLLSYAAALAVANYWTTRLRARGVEQATATALALSLLLSAPATLAYLAASGRAARAFDIPRDALLLSVAYVPALYAHSALYSSALGSRPLAAAASEAVFETAKLSSAALLSLARGVSLRGALASVLVGYAAQLAALAWLLRGDLRRRPSSDVARRILSLTPAALPSLLPPLIGGLDVPLLSALVSNEAVAYYTVVLPFANAVSYSYFLARGLYPALLAGSGGEGLLEEALRMVALTAVPSAMGVAVAAPFLLYVLRPEYTAAAPVLAAAAVTAAVAAFGAVLSDAVQGYERRDAEGAGLREVLRSKVFGVQLLSCAKAAAGVAAVAALASAVKDPLSVATLSRLAWLALAAVELALLAAWAKAGRALARAAGSLLRFAAAAAPATSVAYALQPLRLRELGLAAAAASATYFSLAYAIDPWFRGLARAALRRLLPPPREEGEGQGGGSR